MMKNRIKETNLNDIETPEMDEIDQFETDYVNDPVPEFKLPSFSFSENMLDKEMSDAEMTSEPMSNAEELNLEASDLQKSIDMRPMEQEEAPQAKLLSEYRNLSKSRGDLQSAQKYQADMEKRAALLHGLGQMVQGAARFGRADIDDNKAGAETIRKLGSVPVNQIKDAQKINISELDLQNEEQLNDPNSSISKFMRMTASKRYPEYSKDFENMTAKQLQQLPGLKNAVKPNTRYVDIIENGKVVSKLIDMGTGQTISTLGERGFAPKLFKDPETGKHFTKSSGDMYGQAIPVSLGGEMTTLSPSDVAPMSVGGQTDNSMPKEDPKENSRKLLDMFKQSNPNKGKEFSDRQKEFISDMKEPREVASAVTNLMSKLKPGDSLGDSVDSGLLGGIQTQAAKMAGQKGVLTDQDLVKFAGAGGVRASIDRIFSNVGGKMSDADVKFFKRFSQLMGKSLAEDINNRSQIYVENTYNDAKRFVPQLTKDDVANWYNVDKVAPIVQSSDVKVKIKAPSGAVKEVSEENAAQYLKRPGYERVD